jgi:uncharacterized protein (UPF0548 family)
VAGGAAQLLGVDRAVVVRIGLLEEDFDVSEVFVLADRLVVVGIRNSPVLVRDSAVQLLMVERAVVVLLELVEESARGGFRLGKIDRAVVIGVEALERRSAKEGEAFITAIAGRETASRDARVKVFSVVSFIMMLLEKIGEAGVQRSACRRKALQ